MKFLKLTLLLLLFSCGNKNPEEMIPYLDGYWQIESVSMPDGFEKKFNINTTIDYIEVEGEKGFRKKVMPQIDGSFKTNKAAEEFQIKIENDSLQLNYKTQFDTWTETVLNASEEFLIVKNRDGKIYNYKPFEKFEFNTENPY